MTRRVPSTRSCKDCTQEYLRTVLRGVICACWIVGGVAASFCTSTPHRAQLANGAQLIVETLPHAPLTAIEVWIRAGVADETPETSGVTHLLEHLIFKSPNGALDEAFERAGGVLDAFTERDWTRYRASVLPDRWQPPLHTLLQCLLRPALPETELDKERRIILNDEYALHYADPIRPARYALFAKAFEAHSYALPLLGNRDTLKQLELQAVRAFHEAHYRPDRMTIVLVGAVEWADALRVVEQVFAQPALARASPPTALETPPRPSTRAWGMVEASAGECLALGLHTPPATDVNGWLCAELLRVALAEPYRGLLYEGEGTLPFGRLHSEYLPRLQGSLIALYALPPVTPTDDWQAQVQQRWRRALQQVADGDARAALEQARALTLARHEATMRNPLERARWHGLCAGLRIPLSPEEYALRLRELPIEQVEQLATLQLRDADESDAPARRAIAPAAPLPTGKEAPRNPTQQAIPAIRLRLANGLRVIALDAPEADGVVIQAAVGHPRGRFSAAVGEITARMLFGATHNETERTLAARIARSGGSLRIEWTPAGALITAHARRDAVVNVLSLLKEALLRAEFTFEAHHRALRQAQYDRIYPEGAHAWRFSARLLNLYATEAELEGVSLSDVRAYYHACYRPENIVLVLAGNMRLETLTDWARQLFSEGWERFPTPPTEQNLTSAGLQLAALTDTRGIAYSGYGWITRLESPTQYHALRAWQAVLGEGKRSRLFQATREAHGVGYDLRVETFLLKDAIAGIGWVQRGKAPAPMEQLRESLSAPIHASELERARALLHGEWARLRLNLTAFTATLAWAELSGLGYEAILNAPDHIDALSLASIQSVQSALQSRSSVQLE
ncbi:MAG: insulinase family protein [bacterium]|nr:insulinase family protein [bacterium]